MSRRRVVDVATTSRNPDAGRDASEQDAPDEDTNLVGGRLPEFTVYASHPEIAPVEEHPTLDDEAIMYPLGNDCFAPHSLKIGRDRVGQAGWDLGINYVSLWNLAEQLGKKKIARGQITRLAIASHGQFRGVWCPNGLGAKQMGKNPGYDGVITAKHMYIEGFVRSPAFGQPATPTYTLSVEDYEEVLNKIGLYVRQGGVILLMGCVMGGGPEGTALLKELSRIWHHRRIVAFSTFGIVNTYWMARKANGPFFAGMKDSGFDVYGPLSTRREEQEIHFPTLPWAHEDSENAKAVINYGDYVKDEGDGKLKRFGLLRCPAGEDQKVNDELLNSEDFPPTPPAHRSTKAKAESSPKSNPVSNQRPSPRREGRPPSKGGYVSIPKSNAYRGKPKPAQ